MATTIGFKNPDWDLNKSKYDEIDSLPLMRSPGPVLMILAGYLLFVLKVGPAFMRKREAYTLRVPLIVYNAVQVAFSVFLVQKYFRILFNYGMIPSTCLVNQDNERSQVIYGIWFYFAAKVSELLDTVFFVLRKKEQQVTFLHLYHHSVMMVGTWAYLKYAPSEHATFIGFLNSLVHVFMYSYYGLAALGPHVARHLTWKKYMTSFQLVQFVSVFIHYVLTMKSSECPPPKSIAVFFSFNILFFLILFSNFYKQSYTKKSPPPVNGMGKPAASGKEERLKSQ